MFFCFFKKFINCFWFESAEFILELNTCNVENKKFDDITASEKECIFIAIKSVGNEKLENINWLESSDRSYPPVKQPNGFIDSIKLYEYQLRALSW